MSRLALLLVGLPRVERLPRVATSLLLALDLPAFLRGRFLGQLPWPTPTALAT